MTFFVKPLSLPRAVARWHRWPAMAVLAWCCGHAAFAQAGNASGMPEALKGIQQATGVCRRDDPVAGPASGIRPRNKPRPGMSCTVTPAELEALRRDAGTVLIDVRVRRAEPALSLGDTLQMPLEVVRTKAFLRDKTTVLVGNGKTEQELYEACEELAAQGPRRVRVLQGGLPHWLLSQGLPQEPASIRLSALELWAESQFEANLVMLSPKQEELHKHLPSSVVLAGLDPMAVKLALERWRKDHRNAFLAALVLVVHPDEDTPALRKVQDAVQPMPVLVHVGTAAAYAKRQSEQKAVWAAQARGPKLPGCGL